ncbi:MAG: tyrosine--tRNA ligase [Calditrichaeota bacterium]|nr:MAG: tyrosine--tRNA ligase [Calditrichota bacterium]
MFKPVEEQLAVLGKTCLKIVPENGLKEKLEKSYKTNTPLKIKLGCDPSRPDLHLGHSVVLRALRNFQDFGHEVILIVGDFTGMIGDPTGKSKTRPNLTLEETRKNGQTYFDQASKILDIEKTKVFYNSEWLDKLSFQDVIKLSANYTVAQMLERDDFEKRYSTQQPIAIHEFLYPLSQGYDSVAIESDIEIGGNDQLFNNLVGRELQKAYGKEQQIVMVFPLLEGTDGVQKMSKSLDNYIGIDESPSEMYGKTLSIPDNLIYKYFELCTDLTDEELSEVKTAAETDPRNTKRKLARTIVALYHNEEEAQKAEEGFDKIFIKKDIPDEIPEFDASAFENEMLVTDFLVLSKMTASKGEAKRLIKGGGVSLNGNKVADFFANFTLENDLVVKVGKRKFLKIKK